MKKITKLSIPVLLLLLAACGGGSSPGGSTSGSFLTAEEFANSLATGVYRVDVTVDLSGFSQSGGGLTMTGSGKVRGSQVIALDLANKTSDACDLEGPVTYTDLASEFTDSGEMDNSSCDSRYTRVSDTTFRIEYQCQGVVPDFSATFVRISDSPSFDYGNLSLAFAADTEADSTASRGVCGDLLENNTRITVTPSGTFPDTVVNETDITVVAPYVNGSRVKLSMNFSGSSLVPGDYNVVQFVSEEGADEVSMTFSSAEFGIGNTVSNPGTLNATAGTVTLASVSERAFTGSYNVTLTNGDTLSGDFSLGL